MGDFPDDMIILHGLFGMSDNWNSLAKRFAKKINVHLLDLRNHGRSPHSEDFDYKVMTQDVFNYIQCRKSISSICRWLSVGMLTLGNLLLQDI